MKPYISPYEGYKGPTTKVNARIPTPRFEAVKCLRLQKGTIQITIGILWEKLITECHARGITDFTSSPQFEQLVANSRLIMPGESGSNVEPDRREPSILPDREAAPPNVGAGTTDTREQIADQSHSGADSKGHSGKRSGRGKGQKAKNA